MLSYAHRRVISVLVFAFAMVAAYSSWAIVLPSVHAVEVSYSAKVTNVSGSVLTSTTGWIYPNPDVVRDLSSAKTGVVTGNVSVTVYPEPNQPPPRIETTFHDLQPNQTAYLEIRGLRIQKDIGFVNTTLIWGVVNVAYAPGTEWYEVIRIESESLLGRFSTASLVKFYPYHGSFQSESRIQTREVLFLTLALLCLTVCGVLVSFLWRSWLYPFVTLMILEINVLTYLFIGSAREVHLIPEFQAYKVWLPLQFLYHGSDFHILGNFAYFSIVGVLMESWLRVRKSRRTFVMYYMLPFSPGILEAASSYVRSFSGSVPDFSYGLSFVIILMTIALWALATRRWSTIVARRLDALLLLVAGLPMVGLFGWLFPLLNVGQYSRYDVQTAYAHVIVGGLGILVWALWESLPWLSKGAKALRQLIQFRKTIG